MSRIQRPFRFLGVALLIAALLGGAFLAGTFYPFRQADAASSEEFQVREGANFFSSPLQTPSLGTSAHFPDPFKEMEAMRKEMDEVFDRMFARMNIPSPAFGAQGTFGVPEVDLREEDEYYVARLAMPGIETGSIQVDVQDQTLTISGTRVSEVEHGEGNFLRKERRTGTFQRSIPLAAPVVASDVETTYEDGVVTVRIRKAT